MVIVEAECEFCKNKDPAKFKYYDGALGYEAIICCVCGSYADHFGLHSRDEWSRRYIIKEEIK